MQCFTEIPPLMRFYLLGQDAAKHVFLAPINVIRAYPINIHRLSPLYQKMDALQTKHEQATRIIVIKGM
jgi:hypothetical protein